MTRHGAPMRSFRTLLTALLLAPLAALHAAEPSTDLPTARGLPRILYNNDGEDLTVQAYYPVVAGGSRNGSLWVPNGKHVPIQHVSSLDQYLAYRLGPLAHSPAAGSSARKPH